MKEILPEVKTSETKNPFNVTDKYLEKSGLPRIDQAFLDDFEKRRPWLSFRYRFFYFIRRWCMTILVFTIPFPSILLLDLSTFPQGLFYTWIGIAVMILAMVMDSYFVPRTSDQKLTINEIYAYFYDENFKEIDPEVFLKKLRKQLTVIFLSLIPISMILGKFFSSHLIITNAFAWAGIFWTAWFLFYNWPTLFDFTLGKREYWAPSFETFLSLNLIFKNQACFGHPNQLLFLFSIPRLIGLLIFIATLAIGMSSAYVSNISIFRSEAGCVDCAFFPPLLTYLSSLILISTLWFTSSLIAGLKIISFAKELSKLKAN